MNGITLRWPVSLDALYGSNETGCTLTYDRARDKLVQHSKLIRQYTNRNFLPFVQAFPKETSLSGTFS